MRSQITIKYPQFVFLKFSNRRGFCKKIHYLFNVMRDVCKLRSSFASRHFIITFKHPDSSRICPPAQVKDLNNSATECAAAVLIAFSHRVLTLDTAAAILSMSAPGKTNYNFVHKSTIFVVFQYYKDIIVCVFLCYFVHYFKAVPNSNTRLSLVFAGLSVKDTEPCNAKSKQLSKMRSQKHFK